MSTPATQTSDASTVSKKLLAFKRLSGDLDDLPLSPEPLALKAGYASFHFFKASSAQIRGWVAASVVYFIHIQAQEGALDVGYV